MAGHSKWANIQHRKKAQDAKRGKLFTKIIREITIAARMDGPDINSNPRLRLAVDKAMAGNMGKETVDRAIKRGAGELEGQSFENIRYEGYAVGGVAILIEATTDNRNRTVAEVRFVFSKHGGSLGESGSVSYLFKQLGILYYDQEHDDDQFLEAALNAGAEDVLTEDGGSQVITMPDQLLAVKDKMVEDNFPAREFAVEMRAETDIEVSKDDAEKIMRLIDALEELDDVQDVYCNANFPELK